MNDAVETGGLTARQRFFKNSQRRTKQVQFGDLDLIVKELSSSAIADFIPKLQGDDHAARMRAVAGMIVLCTFDTDGNLVFTSEDTETLLTELGTGEFSDFSEAVLEVNSRTPKAHEDIAKNSTAPTSALLAD